MVCDVTFANHFSRRYSRLYWRKSDSHQEGERMPRMKRPMTAGGVGKFRGTVAIDDYAQQTSLTALQVRELLSRGKLPFTEIEGEIRIDLNRSVDGIATRTGVRPS